MGPRNTSYPQVDPQGRVPRWFRGPPDRPRPLPGRITLLLTQIDHVAIAVHDLEAAIAYYRTALGAEVHHREGV